MKNCPKCGKPVNSEYRFCPMCGTDLHCCPYCSRMLPDGAKFCPYCGKPTSGEAPAKCRTPEEATSNAAPVCPQPENTAAVPETGAPKIDPLKLLTISDEARRDIRKRFMKMRNKVIPGNSGTQPEWKESASIISLSETYKIWIGHEDTESESIQLTFSKVCMRIEHVPWVEESEWPCSGQALIFDKSYSKGDDNPWDSHYSCVTHKAWLLNEPYGMPGMWRFEYYSHSSRS